VTYSAALKVVHHVGAAHAQGLPLLAATLQTLGLIHAINPELAYAGAVKKSLTAVQVRKLDPFALGDLMFV
jgi:hypothetical protein